MRRCLFGESDRYPALRSASALSVAGICKLGRRWALMQLRVQALACLPKRQPKAYHRTRAAAFPGAEL
jgi:hypothetical protein